ncbi:related to beta transducin-like protein [Ramularia collo-cygni]|uniref:Related to beta transducin-like protein n=1 Tax=Ramularia collo-cygni TaxID=112498 RepID=A0A2D3UYW1_9PEZI|nr:related to beta transducin-like protein [Ramularia collo-cygni]CZT16396.1 related to beta transducin-like protein [Ramularia collo-cygni]
MRLLHVSHQRFVEFHDRSKTPEYAILSHAWIQPNHHEVSLQDLRDTDWTEAKQKQGWNKIAYTMNQAKKDGYEYVWIDTCCIDQRNPTELGTSINSMFEWYRDAAVCYAYLDDVDQGSGRPANVAEAFSKTKWITRGWTLQELIAPSAVIFYDSNWQYLTSRRDSALVLSKVTQIDIEVLTTCDGHLRLDSFSIAKRMSWAAERETTRPEDRAYSLFGLFHITMLTQYGEGEQRAFFRLQEEIVKFSADQSIPVRLGCG